MLQSFFPQTPQEIQASWDKYFKPWIPEPRRAVDTTLYAASYILPEEAQAAVFAAKAISKGYQYLYPKPYRYKKRFKLRYNYPKTYTGKRKGYSRIYKKRQYRHS